MTDSWLNDRQRDGGVDRIPLPQGIDGELRLCGKHAAASRHDAAPWDTVVVLVERHEIDRRYPHYTAWLDGAGDRVLWFPIHDLHAPAIAEAAPVVAEIARRLRGGHLVLMHCAAGMGRAGTMAACVLVALGATADEALRIVATARPGAGPEAGAQRELVAALAADQGGDGPQLYHATVDVPVTPDDVERAAARVGDRVRRTPVIGHGSLTLKLELLQHAGSFKTRGAFNRVLSERHVPAAGLIAASGGNHGAALAYVGQVLELPTEIFIPSTSPELKRRNVERFGASVRVIEGYYDDAQAAADARRAETGALEIHPYDHVATVAGQGTMSRELEQQLDGFDTIVVAAGGGGFIAGQAAWLRERVRIVCVSSPTRRDVSPPPSMPAHPSRSR